MPKPEQRYIKPIKFRPTKYYRISVDNKRRPSNYQLILLIICLFFILTFILTARFVHIETNASNADIKIDSFFSPKLGKFYLLLPGRHSVNVFADGFYELKNKLMISADKYQVHSINLTKLPGKIELLIEPVKEVDVSIDGKNYGSTSKYILNVPAGERLLRFSSDRYLSKLIDFDVYGMGKTQQLFVELKPAWANINISSSPKNANIIIDKKKIGITPNQFEILEGQRTIILEKKGFKNWSKTIQLKAGSSINLTNIIMDKVDGFVKISTQPEKAKILLNGKYIGYSPMKVSLPPKGGHLLRLTKEGYKTIDQKVMVKSGETEELNFTFKPETARLTFITKPRNAQLFIDQAFIGNATQSIILPTKPHLINVQAEGYSTYEATISPRVGFEKVIQVRLKTLEETLLEKVTVNKKKARNLMESKMRLFNAQKVIIGSNKNDKNRQVNEAMREVSIKRPFYISESEVTNLEYKGFLAMHFSGFSKSMSLDESEQPVVNIKWSDAAKFCNWLSRQDGFETFYIIKYGEVVGIKPNSVGYRLPTEAEWETAAQNGIKRFFWGDVFPPPNSTGNFSESQINTISNTFPTAYFDGYEVSAPIKSFGPNTNQIYDLYGNVSEWVHDFYKDKFDKNNSFSNLGPISGEKHVIKGGSWMNSSPVSLGIPFRTSGNSAKKDVGFRVARYAQ